MRIGVPHGISGSSQRSENFQFFNYLRKQIVIFHIWRAAIRFLKIRLLCVCEQLGHGRQHFCPNRCLSLRGLSSIHLQKNWVDFSTSRIPQKISCHPAIDVPWIIGAALVHLWLHKRNCDWWPSRYIQVVYGHDAAATLKIHQIYSRNLYMEDNVSLLLQTTRYPLRLHRITSSANFREKQKYSMASPHLFPERPERTSRTEEPSCTTRTAHSASPFVSAQFGVDLTKHQQLSSQARINYNQISVSKIPGVSDFESTSFANTAVSFEFLIFEDVRE